jgi:prepilin-type N-terminal cleavage/methylation domain-containing protein
MYQLNKHKITLPRHCSGFSMVELMIAMVITLILLAGIGQIFLSSKKSFTIQDSLGRQQENGRYVVNALAQDLRRSGYLGGSLAITEIAGSLALSTGADTCTGANWALFMQTPVVGLDGTAAGYDCIPNYLAGSGDIIAVRYGAPWGLGSVTTPNVVNTRIYLHSNPKEPKTARLYRGNNLPAKTPGDRQAELVARAYFIANSGQSTCTYQGANLPIPSLHRVDLNDNSQPDAPGEIAAGIERLQILYGIDNVGADNSIDAYVKADAVADWDQVIAIRFWVLTRAECPETGYTNTTTYVMGSSDGSEDFTPPANDHYRRQLYQTTVQLRNRVEGI